MTWSPASDPASWTLADTTALLDWLATVDGARLRQFGPGAAAGAALLPRADRGAPTRHGGLLHLVGWPTDLVRAPNAWDGPSLGWWRMVGQVLVGVRRHEELEGRLTSTHHAGLLAALEAWAGPATFTAQGWWEEAEVPPALGTPRRAEAEALPIWRDGVMAPAWSAGAHGMLRALVAPRLTVGRNEGQDPGLLAEDLVRRATEAVGGVERMSPGLAGRRAVFWLAMLEPAQRLAVCHHWLAQSDQQFHETFQMVVTSAPVLEAAAAVDFPTLRPFLRLLLGSEYPWARELGVRMAGQHRDAFADVDLAPPPVPAPRPRGRLL